MTDATVTALIIAIPTALASLSALAVAHTEGSP